MRPYILAEANYAYTKANPYEVAVLPLGATEPHNLHLPYGTDVFEGTIVGEQICEAAHDRGAQGRAAADDSLRHRNEHASPSAGDERRSDDALSLRHRHRQVVRAQRRAEDRAAQQPRRQRNEAAAAGTGRQDRRAPVPLQLVHGADRRRMPARSSNTPTTTPARWRRRSSSPRYPHLVAKTADGKLAADDGATAQTRFEAINRGWVSITRPWHLLTTNTGSGYPHAAAPEKAEKMLTLLVERLGTFLVELSAAKLDERFPY